MNTQYLSWHRFLVLATWIALALSTGGCSSLLPKTVSQSPTFQSFEEAKNAIESLVPRTSNLQALTEKGLIPAKQPNTVILTHADVVRRMVNGSVMAKDDLDPGIVACINAKSSCKGWEFSVASITKARTGNFWTDFANFNRKTETTGWRFKGLVLLVNDVVVYRGWGGQPDINEVEISTNPLGPFQDMGPSIITTGQ